MNRGLPHGWSRFSLINHQHRTKHGSLCRTEHLGNTDHIGAVSLRRPGNPTTIALLAGHLMTTGNQTRFDNKMANTMGYACNLPQSCLILKLKVESFHIYVYMI